MELTPARSKTGASATFRLAIIMRNNSSFIELMKRALIVLALLYVGQQHSLGDNAVSIEQFKQIKSADERLEIIRHAPKEQQAELIKISQHLGLVERNGGGKVGETVVDALKRRAVVEARGFPQLAALPNDYNNVWQNYIWTVRDADTAAGKTTAQVETTQLKLIEEQKDENKRVAVMDNLVFTLAPTPKALELEKRAQALRVQNLRRIDTPDASSKHKVKKEDVLSVKKQLDQILEDLKKLPALSAAQVQKEYDDLPEGIIR